MSINKRDKATAGLVIVIAAAVAYVLYDPGTDEQSVPEEGEEGIIEGGNEEVPAPPWVSDDEEPKVK